MNNKIKDNLISMVIKDKIDNLILIIIWIMNIKLVKK